MRLVSALSVCLSAFVIPDAIPAPVSILKLRYRTLCSALTHCIRYALKCRFFFRFVTPFTSEHGNWKSRSLFLEVRRSRLWYAASRHRLSVSFLLSCFFFCTRKQLLFVLLSLSLSQHSLDVCMPMQTFSILHTRGCNATPVAQYAKSEAECWMSSPSRSDA